MPVAGRVLSRTVMPATLAAAIGGAWLAMRAGASAESVVALFFFACMPWVAAPERVLPYRAEWNRAQGDLLADAAYLPLNSLVIAGMRSLIAALVVGVASWVSLHVGLSLWPHSWPLLAQLPLAWVVVE